VVFSLSAATGPGDANYVALSLDEPPGPPGGGLQTFSYDGAEVELAGLAAELPDGAVRKAGQYLYEAIANGHAELKDELRAALKIAAADRCPVFVRIDGPADLEALPWEAMCSPGGDFLGLDERWAAGRIVRAAAGGAPWPFPPLRVAAVLSCLGVPAEAEWAALRDAVGPLARAGLPTEMRLVVSEPGLHETIEREAGAGATPKLSVTFVPPELEELQSAIASFKPHILHFFCHGSAAGTPHLELAVKTDWGPGYPKRGLTVEAGEILKFTDPQHKPWLVVLNCCEGAAPGGEETQSLALNLAYKGGVPAVVAMREPVTSNDASIFTQAFYSEFAHYLTTQTRGGDAIDWPRLLVKARLGLARKHAGRSTTDAASSTKEWTLPMMYVQDQPFSPPRGDPRALLELEVFENMLSQQPADAPFSWIEDIEARIAELRRATGGGPP
jgi:hypothetical protein